MNSQAENAQNGGQLPAWNLNDLYPGVESEALKQHLIDAERNAETFQQKFRGGLAALSGAKLADAIAEYQRLQEVLGRIGSYASLMHSGDVTNPEFGRFYQNMSEKITTISAYLLFFTLEINQLEDAALDEKLMDSSLAYYRPWLRDLRAFRPHQLADELERLLHDKSVSGRSAWSRLYDQTLGALHFTIDGEVLAIGEALDLMSHHDRAKRERAAGIIAETLGSQSATLSLVINTIAKDKEIEDRWRNFPRPISSRNLSNFVEDDVVDALMSSVAAAYPETSHRYYKMKAKWLGLDKLEYWDRNAPLPGDEDVTIPWSEAEHLVLDAFGSFSPEMADIGREFFQRQWIDAAPRPGKSPGAFAHPTVPSAHPYILLNYLGRSRDVMTLAHELGHGVHQVLASKQGYLMSETPLTLAETASVFGEMLTFRRMLDRETNPARKRIMLARKVEDMINTVVRQVAFAEFERRVHDERRESELTPDRIGEIWLAVQGESLGDGIRFSSGYEKYWSYIPHFIHTPFYVYAYAFGDCLVNSLYARYEQSNAGFAERYLEMLKAGGTLRHKELLAPFGLDASDPAFWNGGLDLLRHFIDELEALDRTA